MLQSNTLPLKDLWCSLMSDHATTCAPEHAWTHVCGHGAPPWAPAPGPNRPTPAPSRFRPRPPTSPFLHASAHHPAVNRHDEHFPTAVFSRAVAVMTRSSVTPPNTRNAWIPSLLSAGRYRNLKHLERGRECFKMRQLPNHRDSCRLPIRFRPSSYAK